MFDFAAASRDAAALRASTLNDRTVPGSNFKVGNKVRVLDQGTKVGDNTVVKLLSKRRRNNREGAQPRSSRATKQTRLPGERT